ncbi:MAG: 1,4-alpha-glucan branching protein GlgB [Thioalkalivibrionaceae bacterium]
MNAADSQRPSHDSGQTVTPVEPPPRDYRLESVTDPDIVQRINALVAGRLHDPFTILGRHPIPHTMPSAEPAASLPAVSSARQSNAPSVSIPASPDQGVTQNTTANDESQDHAPPRWILREFLPHAQNAWIELLPEPEDRAMPPDPAGHTTNHASLTGEHSVLDTLPSDSLDGSGSKNTLVRRPLTRLPNSDIFIADDLEDVWAPPRHYRVDWTEKRDGSECSVVSPWSFPPLLGEEFLARFSSGDADDAHHHLGAHVIAVDGVEGVLFAVWAPGVPRVSVVGDFNGWHGLRHPMRNRGASGVWELFIPGVTAGDRYKFEICTEDGHILLKADPFARRAERRPHTASIVAQPLDDHLFGDDDWLAARAKRDWLHAPLSIYEVHAGSWRKTEDGDFYNWDRLAQELIPYVLERGFTHIELMPIFAHPLDQSWGYQVTGFFAPSARFGEPAGLARFIDTAHRAGLGVLLDWVPAHFPKDDWALARFTGKATYEHPDPLRGEHPDWGTLIFDYGRPEVRSFLRSSARYWIDEFHFDGLRVDAVASMLYLDYSRSAWRPNARGGREHDEAITLLQVINRDLHRDFPGVMTIAEESTAWPGVSRPVDLGGLGFSMKWNMGWMHDSLRYFARDPIHRQHHHHDLTFAQLYAYHENFILPLSHDEVVHGKRTLLNKMSGNESQRFANLRLLLAWQALHPGKTLLFMGTELAMETEWAEHRALDWSRRDDRLTGPETARRVNGIDSLIRDLNHLGQTHAALYRYDFESRGFQWIDVHASSESVLSFVRRGDSDDPPAVCIFNATPVQRHWQLALPHAGAWSEIFNSDAALYGGDNNGNLGRIVAHSRPHLGLAASAEVLLPPLSALIFIPDPT